MTLLALTIGGRELKPSRVAGRTGLSTLFRFDVVAAADDAPAVADLLGQPFTLTLRDRFERSLCVRGVTMEVERTVGEDDRCTVRAVLEPEVAPLRVGRDSRVFQDMSAVDVVKRVLERAAIPAASVRWSLHGNYEPRRYCAQYDESDWAFIERLLVEEGIHYWFEHGAEATVLVLSDNSTAAEEIEGDATIPFHDASGLRATRDCIVFVRQELRITPERVRLRDYDDARPRLSLDAVAGEGAREIYDFPGRFRSPAQGEARARARLEALRARASITSGQAWTTRLCSGLVFELTDHPIDALNGRYLVDEVRYAATEQRGGEGEEAEALTMAFTAIPAATPFRAEGPVVRRPGGPQTGVVVGAPGKEIHPDSEGRVRVQFHWDREGARDDKASTWMRVGQVPLGGSMILPRIGWDMLVCHYEEDIDAPFVASHLYDGEHPVPYPLPANKTRTAVQTATTPGGGSTNELRFEDKKGSEEVFINASRDMNITIGHDRSEQVGANDDHTVGSNLDVSIGSNLKVGVGADQSTTVGASETLTVSGNRSVDVGASESTTIGGSRTVTLKGLKIEATGGRSLTVGGSMMGASLLGVSRMTLGTFSLTVGGSWISVAATGVANLTGGACAETVGGAKIQAAGKAVTTSVKGAAAETVGGAYVIAAAGTAGETATGPLVINVGGALIANAPKIVIEGQSEISIRAGAATLTIKPGSVEVKAPAIAAP
ncbi:MAG TPA: type VI secretion system tip protein TssI/VgrG, partial [Candidatus Nanopelagicales bacterium]|nr:type VI secretion system tip protein TssI/VgrG [Candidatus Nanopelagicales bacterium]